MPLPTAPKTRASRLTAEEITKAPVATPPAPKVITEKKSTTRTQKVEPEAKKVDLVEIKQPKVRAVKAEKADPVKATSTPKKTAKMASGMKRLFVLDTNVLIHDPNCLSNFAEHDVYLPMTVLEELDAHKKGTSDTARNARQISRALDDLIQHFPKNDDGNAGIPLNATGNAHASGKLYFESKDVEYSDEFPVHLEQGKADNQILGAVSYLRKVKKSMDVVLVSNDINMRIKARALGIPAEPYNNDKVLDDMDLMYTGQFTLPENFWEKNARKIEAWKSGESSGYSFNGGIASELHVNQFVNMPAGSDNDFSARVTGISGHKVSLKTTKDYSINKNNVFGINTKNREQNYAMNLLMDPEVDFVTIAGQAGSGKTLLVLAAGLEQVLNTKEYSEIIMTRATVSVGDEIGFLPGSEEEKMSPWMGALDDNLEFMASNNGGTPISGNTGKRSMPMDLLRQKIKIKSMSFMRGRTFLKKYVIIDEAQNLTPKQMKTLITRAGPGTKIICMGNLAQIDTPYLTEGSSGLTFAVDRFKGWQHSGHVTLQRGERSRLADHAADVLGG